MRPSDTTVLQDFRQIPQQYTDSIPNDIIPKDINPNDIIMNNGIPNAT